MSFTYTEIRSQREDGNKVSVESIVQLFLCMPNFSAVADNNKLDEFHAWLLAIVDSSILGHSHLRAVAHDDQHGENDGEREEDPDWKWLERLFIPLHSIIGQNSENSKSAKWKDVAGNPSENIRPCRNNKLTKAGCQRDHSCVGGAHSHAGIYAERKSTME